MLIKIEGIEPQFKVYKMSENVEGKIYIGKTKCPLKERMKGHRYGKMPCDKHFSNVGWNNVTVEIIDTANSDAELLVRENKKISEYYGNNKVNLLNKNNIFFFGIKKIDLNCDENYLHRIEIFDHWFFCQRKFDYVCGDSIFKFIKKINTL